MKVKSEIKKFKGCRSYCKDHKYVINNITFIVLWKILFKLHGHGIHGQCSVVLWLKKQNIRHFAQFGTICIIKNADIFLKKDSLITKNKPVNMDQI